MGRRGARALVAAVVCAATVLLTGTAASGGAPRPTADPAAPTPTAPQPGRPPQGSAPDGSTVGGEELDTRGVVAADGTPPLPGMLAAQSWLVADAGSGEVLAACDPHGRFYPASTLKTLTLLTLAHRLDPTQVVTGTPEDEQMEGTRVGLIAGGQYPVGFLFLALILQSGNDAANALARAAGGTAATVTAMTRTAESIGAYDTVVGTPSGLDVTGQSSSAYDLALIFRDLVQDPFTATVLSTRTAVVPEVPGRAPPFQIQNQNPLAAYPGTLGGKTGFTDAARHTFVTAAERDGRRLVVSVLDTENQPLRAEAQAALLLDWGFSVPPGTAGVGRLVEPADLVATPAATSAATAAEPDRPTAAPRGSGRGMPLLGAGVALAVAVAAGVAVVSRRRAGR